MGTGVVRIVGFGRPDRSDLASAVLSAAAGFGASAVHVSPEGSAGFATMDQGTLDWRVALDSAHWLVNSSSTVLEGDAPRGAWGASMAFAELEGSRSVMVVGVPESPELLAEAWGSVIERIRQIHLLFFESDALGAIADLEGIEPESLLSSVRDRGLVPIVCSYEPGTRKACVEHALGSTEVRTSATMDPESWLAAFLCKLPLSGPGKLGLEKAARAETD